MSAASFATSVPLIPMAMPMSACLSAGASFTPSPVMATTSPRFFHARTILSLSMGDTRAYTVNRLLFMRSVHANFLVCDCEHAQRVLRHRLVCGKDLRPCRVGERPLLVVALRRHTSLQHNLGGPFHESEKAAIRHAVDGGHPLALRTEREFRDPGRVYPSLVLLQARLCRQYDKRSFGGVTLDEPAPGVVAQHGVAAQQ